jgi:hypothetical protein
VAKVKIKKHYHYMARLITDHRIRTMAEVGVFRGYFCKEVLRAAGGYLDQYWGIDQYAPLVDGDTGWMSRIPQEEWDRKYHKACEKMVYFPTLRIVRRPRVEAAKLFPDGYFDLVYLDASHFYDEVLKDIAAWKPKVRPGGLLGGHDYTNKKSNMRAKSAVDTAFPEGVLELPDKMWFVHV